MLEVDRLVDLLRADGGTTVLKLGEAFMLPIRASDGLQNLCYPSYYARLALSDHLSLARHRRLVRRAIVTREAISKPGSCYLGEKFEDAEDGTDLERRRAAVHAELVGGIRELAIDGLARAAAEPEIPKP